MPGPRSIRLDQQFHERRCAIIGLQETRTPEGRRITDHYTIFSSGYAQCGRSRHFGCELWIHRFLPLATAPDGTKVTLAHFQPIVLYATARVLLLRLQGPFDLFVVAGHAPCLSADRPLDQLQQWWTMLTEQIHRLPRTAPLIVCLDANAPLASVCTEFFEQHHAEPTNLPGQLFEQFLCETKLFAPATFASHSGSGTTWRHPRGHFLRRDYVLVNEVAHTMCTRSEVLTDFDTGFGHQDHFPAMLSFCGRFALSKPPSNLRWDFVKMQDPHARQSFEEALASLPLPHWQIDVDSHASLVESQIVQLAQQHFGAPPAQRYRPTLQEATLNGIQLKRQALDMLRMCPPLSDPLLIAELKALESILRPMVLHAQQAWYASWLDDIDEAMTHHDAAQLYRKLQRLGRRKNQPSAGPRPLPILTAPDGSCATSTAQCQAIWCAQFSKLEAGVPATSMQLQQLHCAATSDVMVAPNKLMSATDILAAIRRMKSGKAPGPGLLPIDVLKAGGPTIAQLLLPLLTKANCHLREPLAWKGGLLIPLFKGKGSPQNAASYRSIFLSDACAKIHHSHIRKSLADAWSMTNDVIQQGGKKGCSTDIAHHLLHSYFAWARAHSTSCALLFVDLHAAFYTVVRSMFQQQPLHDDLLCAAMRQLGITADDWHDILALLATDNATRGTHPRIDQ